VNALPSHSPGYIRVPASRSPRQLASMLAALARIRPLAETTFARVLAAERHRLPAGATIVLITGLLDHTLREQAQAYRSAGHPVTLLLVGDALREARTPGLAAYWIGDEARWRERCEIRMAGAAQ
jgi:uncharacterized protein (DUF58 family)